MQRRARLGESELRSKPMWDAVSFRALEAKILGDQIIDEHEIIFSKWIKIKSKRSYHLSPRTIIKNKSGI